jgi:outer membrane protein assembly factor BamE (lipoprotein component of BamABCDE complex)
LSPSGSGSSPEKVQLRKGMTFQEIRSLLGAPVSQTEWGNQTRWRYPDMTIIFENGRLKDVKF